MDNALYPYSPIAERDPIQWPGGARVAFYIGLNIEHFHVDAPSTSLIPSTASLTPDPMNFGWRDYGLRVGFWRILDALDRTGIRASVLLNSEVAQRYPQVIEAGRARNWVWLAHGRTNSRMHTGMSADAERAELKDIITTIERATGQRPLGWMGPGLTETFNTAELLAELGVQYVLDWTSDDQPFELSVPGMLSVPYTVELNDVVLFATKSYTGPQFRQMVIDQFDQLYADSEHSGRVMALALHPFVIGQPSRYRYLREALDYIAQHKGVWLTTSDEIAAHYAQHRITSDLTVK